MSQGTTPQSQQIQNHSKGITKSLVWGLDLAIQTEQSKTYQAWGRP
jgi:hypothetical protein